jgi:hypothetical protein
MRIIETSSIGDVFILKVMDEKGNTLLLRHSGGNAECVQELRRLTFDLRAALHGDCAHFHNQPGAADKYLKQLKQCRKDEEAKRKTCVSSCISSCDKSSDPGGWNTEYVRGLEEELRIWNHA